MGGYRILGVVLLSILWGCGFGFDSSMDLSRNPNIYQSPRYEAPRQTEELVYIQRLRDRREAQQTDVPGGGYREVKSEDEWDRPIPVMVEEILQDEISRSEIYGGLSQGKEGKANPADIVVEPSLLAMYRAYESGPSDRRSYAEAALRIRVRGPVDAAGKRPVLLNRVFRERVGSPRTKGKAPDSVPFAGRALQVAMRKMLVALYESNIKEEEEEEEEEKGDKDKGR